MLTSILLIVLAYLFGSVSSAIVVAKSMGLTDPRTDGSNNPGATNMMRLNGKKAAAITLVGDLLKGTIPVLIAKFAGADVDTQLLVALAAFLGHLHPVFFSFKGGKGIATALGVLIGLDWRIAALTALVWFAIYKLKGVSSIAGMSSTAIIPIIVWFVTGNSHFVLFAVVMGAFVLWRHKSNIQGLLNGSGG